MVFVKAAYSWIIRVDVALAALESLLVEVVRTVNTLRELVSNDFLSYCGGQSILHSQTFEVTVLY